ncbi:MAG TPA: sensor domain-containing protein [Mycobacteriales bacterium]|nr:sensor domain-containing protein [Mycobacteriales bacterium]
MDATQPTGRRPGVLRCVLYLTITCLLGWIFFGAAVAALFFSTLTVVIWIGLPLLALSLVLIRAMGSSGRALAGGLMGRPIETPYRPLPPAGWLARLRTRIADPATWKSLAWVAVAPFTSFGWLVAAAILGLPGGMYATAWIWFRWLPDRRMDYTSIGDWTLVVDNTRTGLAWAVPAAVVLMLGALLVRTGGRIHVVMTAALLGPSERARLRNRALALEQSRRRVVDAAEEERRRIERDLHDGTQQRLVSMALELGRARELLRSDPDGAEAFLASAHEESKRAIAELRNLVRGIHPAVLTDRGLDAAISALVGRSPVPVEVTARLTGARDENAETVAYFVIAEALTNIAKHARATRAWVAVERVGRHLILEIRDDGAGGAAITPGGGLAGLADRVSGVDGTLEVSSPPGGPTVLRVELPCAS